MKAIVYALITIFLWSTLAASAVYLASVPPFLLIGIALLIGSLCGLPYIRQWKQNAKVLALGIYGIFGFHFCIFLALRSAPPVEANLIEYLWPLLIVVLTPVFFKGYKLTVRHILAATLGFIGALLIATGGKLSISSEYLFGYSLALGAAIIWSTYSLLSKKNPFPTGAIGLFCLISGLMSLGCHLVLEKPYWPTNFELRLIVALGGGPMGIAFFFWDRAMKMGDPRVIGSLSYLTPMFSTLLLVLTGKGELSLISMIAMIMIVSGAVVGSAK